MLESSQSIRQKLTYSLILCCCYDRHQPSSIFLYINRALFACPNAHSFICFLSRNAIPNANNYWSRMYCASTTYHLHIAAPPLAFTIFLTYNLVQLYIISFLEVRSIIYISKIINFYYIKI